MAGGDCTGAPAHGEGGEGRQGEREEEQEARARGGMGEDAFYAVVTQFATRLPAEETDIGQVLQERSLPEPLTQAAVSLSARGLS